MNIRGDQVKQVVDLLAQGKSIPEIAGTVGLDIGDVQSVLAGATRTYVETLEGGLPSSGPPSPGGLRVIKFDFAHDTVGRDTGLVVFTPKVGDVLVDAWCDIHEAFDGTTPYVDVGTEAGFAAAAGLFSEFSANGSPCALTAAEDASNYGGGDYAAQSGATPTGPIGGLRVTATLTNGAFGSLQYERLLPVRFVTTNPLKLYANQFGGPGWPADGSTVGSATFYIVIASPATA